MKPNLIILDVETGGFDWTKNPITELGLIVVESAGFKEIDRYQTYIKPYGNLVIEESALQATQVKMQDIQNGELIIKVANKLMELFAKYKNGKSKPIFVGHNFVEFDIYFLEQISKLYEKFDIWKYMSRAMIDTQRLMEIKDANPKNDVSLSRFSLNTCCERMGIVLKSAHGAMADVTATWKLLTKLCKNMRKDVTTSVDLEQTTDKQRNYFEF